MFLARRPSRQAIERFIETSRTLPLSYREVGIAEGSPPGYRLGEASVGVGRGEGDFERAKAALAAWQHFDLGWVELFPRSASIEPTSVVAVLIRHLGFWSLNGCRVLYGIGHRHAGAHFGFAYGTLANHAERGEELFEMSLRPRSAEDVYRVRAVSKPRAPLARLGSPIARALQARFRRDSAEAMRRAVRERA